MFIQVVEKKQISDHRGMKDIIRDKMDVQKFKKKQLSNKIYY